MAAFLDGCRFNPTAGGTTDWTYSSAVTGYQSPAAAGVANGTLYKYRAESADLSQWELGEGAYNTSTGVLARTIVLFNSLGTGTASGQSGAGTKINFSTVPQVAVVALAEDLSGLALNNTFSGTQAVTNTTDASSITSGGAFTIAGGLAIAKKLYAGAAAFITGVLTVSAGSASAPSVVGPAATNAGLWFPGANQVSLSANGLETLRFSGASTVGRASAFQAQFNCSGNALSFKGSATTSSIGIFDFSDSAFTSCGAINIDQGAHTTAYLTSSDERAKPYRSLLSADVARAVVDGLEIYDFDDERNLVRGVGPLAQQAYHVLPRMVSAGDSDENLNIESPACQLWQVDLSKAVPYLIANLQECNRQIDSLKLEVATLQAKLVK